MDDELEGMDERHLNIHFTPEIMAGIYANHARVHHTPHELTITFGVVGMEPGDADRGVAVARVHMSPLFTSELRDALDDNFSKWQHTQSIRDLPEAEGHDDDLEDEYLAELPSALQQLRSPRVPQRRATLEPRDLVGSYSNFANVSHSDYEFTITFARIDHEVDDVEVPGVVVCRVNCSPLLLRELVEGLGEAYDAWASGAGGPAGR